MDYDDMVGTFIVNFGYELTKKRRRKRRKRSIWVHEINIHREDEALAPRLWLFLYNHLMFLYNHLIDLLNTPLLIKLNFADSRHKHQRKFTSQVTKNVTYCTKYDGSMWRIVQNMTHRMWHVINRSKFSYLRWIYGEKLEIRFVHKNGMFTVTFTLRLRP